MSEPHDVVKLLLARMESHPEEFKSHADRWDRVLLEVLEHGNEAEIAAIHASVRNIRLGEAHEDMMDELCNGEERRRKHAEDTEYERNLSKSLVLTKQQQLTIANGGTGATTARYPTSTDMENNGVMGALRKLI
jgi:hypothetical protein